eukprot:gene5983-6222_t
MFVCGHTEFANCIQDNSIHDLKDFIAANKRDYLSTGKLSEPGKDQVEEQVGVAVRTITQHLDALKNGVVAAQQPEGGQALINEQTAAHLHGSVLVLVERLHSVTSSFDKCRALRYQQSLAKELRQHRKAPKQQVSSWASEDHHTTTAAEPDRDSGKQQVQGLDMSTQRLLAELQSAAQQAQEVERTMRQVATLNQMISTAVMHQAELVEQLYNNAVDATHNLQRGNTELKKTIKVNRSSRLYLLVLLVTASLLLLFFDWFNS